MNQAPTEKRVYLFLVKVNFFVWVPPFSDMALMTAVGAFLLLALTIHSTVFTGEDD